MQNHIEHLVHQGVLHEQAPPSLNGSLITTSLAMTGSKWATRGTSSTEHSFMLRISKSFIVNLFNQVARGNTKSMQTIAKLYSVGLCVPQSDVYSKLWTEIQHYDAIELSDGLLTQKDLRSVLRNQLRESVNASHIYIPSFAYMSMMRSVSGYRLSEEKSKVRGDAVRVDNSMYDMYLIYKRTYGQTKMVGSFLHFVGEKDYEKFIDITYQAQRIVPFELPLDAFGKSDGYYVVYGKLSANQKIDYPQKIKEWIAQDVDRYADLVREKVAKDSPYTGFLVKYRELRAKADLFIREFSTKRKPSARQIAEAKQAQLLLDTYAAKQKANRELKTAARLKAKSEDPVNLFSFRAVDLFLWSSSSGIVTIPENISYKKIVKKLTDLGFTCTSGKQGQNFIRNLASTTYWQKQ